MFDFSKLFDLNKQTLWTEEQRAHLERLIAQGATIAYVCTDTHGRPANGGPKTLEWQVYTGCVQTVPGPFRLCGENALHGTFEPHRWAGSRVWIAGFLGEVVCEEDKLGSLHREIVGEVFPETALSPSVGVRLGRKDLQGAHLQGAFLQGAFLQYAFLQYANLQGAHLQGAFLQGAFLQGAFLQGAFLQYAFLQYANLQGAHLQGALLQDAILRGANLQYANLQYANLQGADLQYAILQGALLQGARLQGAILQNVDLQNANLHGAYLPNVKNIPEVAKYGWINDKYGYLTKK